MTQLPAGAEGIRFSQWEIRPLQRQLLVRGEPVKLGSRAFDVLLALVERCGRVAGKGELMTAAWGTLVVEENNLSVQIAALRKVLGAAAIVNVTGQGYRLGEAPLRGSGAAAPPGPPTLPRLFGRDDDLRDVSALTAVAQLVSIVGTGGVGKTSLARAVLAPLAGQYRDGVHWLELAPLAAGTPLLPLVAKVLGLPSRDVQGAPDELAASLGQLQAVVVLDNCEHLADDVAALLLPLLQRAPALRWIATSQEPLRLAGEAVYRLAPLAVPLPDAGVERAMASGALALLCERVRGADRRFELTAATIGLATELCRQLDGLPLAIEMAAARVATLGLQGVHDQIDQRLRLRAGLRNAPQRHHTLLQTLEWSYGLLSAVEQRVFRQLQPFVGGFNTALAQALCSSPVLGAGALPAWQAADALSALIDKSLVQRSTVIDDYGQPIERLHLLETGRDYAQMQLQDLGEPSAVRQAHAAVLTAWFETAAADEVHWRDADWAARYLPEYRNLVAALTWACGQARGEQVAPLVAALAQLDAFANNQAEVAHYAAALPLLEGAALPQRARARLALGWANHLDGSRERGTELIALALADFEQAGDAVGAFDARLRLVRLYMGRPGKREQAHAMWLQLKQCDDSAVPLRLRLLRELACDLRFGERSLDRMAEILELTRKAGFDVLAAACSVDITDELLRQGDFEAALTMSRELLTRGEPRSRNRALLYHNQALALVQLERHDEAVQPAREVLRSLPSAAYLVLDLFALVAVRTGHSPDAALMAGCSLKHKQERDIQSEPAEAAVIAETNRLLAAALEPERLADLSRQGAASPVAEMLVLAFPTA